jgi:2'-5' RNA ligase
MSTLPAPATARIFLALVLEDKLLEQVLSARKKLERQIRSAAVRWVPREQLHLTLKFFGNMAREQLPDLATALRPLCLAQPVLSLDLKHYGCFPDSRRPRVLWLGIAGAIGPLATFQQQIHEATRAFGDHQEERPFHPHLTLARMKNVSPDETRQLAAVLDRTPADSLDPWLARELVLMESRLTPQGSIYHPAAHFLLAPSAPP